MGSLNEIVTMYLDYAERQAHRGNIMYKMCIRDRYSSEQTFRAYSGMISVSCTVFLIPVRIPSG